MSNKKDEKYVHLTYPYDRPGPGHKQDPKLNLQSERKPFNYALPSLKGLSDIPWKDITACTISSGGSSNGTILLQTMEGNLAVKGPSNPALEYFSYLFYRELKLRSPHMRVLQHTEEEFKKAIDKIQKAAYTDSTLKYKVRQVIDRPFLLVMEYIPAQKLYQLGEKRAKMCFDPSYPEGRDRLIRLGILYAADTLLNINNRYPLIWGNSGNPENLLVGFETTWINTTEELFDSSNVNMHMTSLCPVDNRPLLIGKKTGLSQEAYDLYLEEFERVVRYAFEGLKPVIEGKMNPYDSSTKRFDYASLTSTFIYNHTSIDIKSFGELQILLGLVIGYVNIYHMGLKRIERMKKKVEGLLKSDWKNLWKDDCERIKLDIIKDEFRIIEKHIKGNENVIGWVGTITLNNYFQTFEPLNDDDVDTSLALDPDKSYLGSNGATSSQNVGEYDEWLNKKMNEHFGIDETTIVKQPQSKPQEEPKTQAASQLPAQPVGQSAVQPDNNQAEPKPTLPQEAEPQPAPAKADDKKAKSKPRKKFFGF